MIEVNLVFLFIIFLVMFFTLVSLFFYLMIQKYMTNNKKTKIDQLKEAYRLDMFHFLQSGVDSKLRPDGSQEKFIALIELLIEYANVLESEDIKQRISVFAKQYLTDYIEGQLKKNRWSLRMNALYAIEDFYMIHLSANLHDLYEKKHITLAEKFQILKLFAKFGDEKTVHYIKSVPSFISDFTLLSILSLLKEDHFHNLVEDFSQLPKRMQYMVVETIGKKQYLQYYSLLQKLLQSDEEEMRIRTLKTFAYTGAPVDEKILAAFFQSSSWQVRMMAAKVAGVKRLSQYAGQLISMLSDRNYVVRSEAAKALLQFKDGVNILRNVIDESHDDFARDMAREWLEKERNHE